jgi:hypothetical protein
VNSATISSVSPSSGPPGTQVTITGSGFGSLQGGGQVWLGTAYGFVQSWSGTQIVAVVGSGSTFGNAQALAQQRNLAARTKAERQARMGRLGGALPSRSRAQAAPPAASGSGSGNVQVLQNGVWSNPAPFSVNILQITGVSPVSASPGMAVTITGTGLGALQGSGSVWLGSMAGQVQSWSDTQVVAAAAPGSLTGIVRIQQNGAWSNALTFTMPGNTTILVPNLLNLVVGDTATVQASNLSGQPLTGLTWTSSDPTVVSLTTDNPPLLTALAAGHVTIVAGTASVDVTVAAGALPLGTVLWSNPGDGSGVDSIVPAVPSPTGVADVFAFQNDLTVQAITSDGKTAWTADLSKAYGWGWNVLPDFQGGLVAMESRGGQYLDSIVKLDGMTGQPSVVYTAPNADSSLIDLVAHPDGTVFALTGQAVIGIDASTGGQKFSVPLPVPINNSNDCFGSMIIAGDGYAYLPFGWMSDPGPGYISNHLRVLRVNSAGAFDVIPILDWTGTFTEICGMEIRMITNADTGTLVTWNQNTQQPSFGMAITTGTSASVIGGPVIPNQASSIDPILQAQDGSFVGTVDVGPSYPLQNYMIAFDASGGLRWSVAGDYQPQIATADGGIIATDDNGSPFTFGGDGNATGQMAVLLTQSWTRHLYQYGSVDQVTGTLIDEAASFEPLANGDYSPESAGIPIDSITNNLVTKILPPAMWGKFEKSNCSVVFGNPQGIPNYSLQTVRKKQDMTNFYDVGNDGVGSLTLQDVTAGQIGNAETITRYLANNNAVTVNLGYSKQTAVVFQQNVLAQPHVEFIVAHELLLHAYAGVTDDAVFSTTFYTAKGLWRPDGSTATTNITTWMGTDCTCTPGKPGTTCPANTAKW